MQNKKESAIRVGIPVVAAVTLLGILPMLILGYHDGHDLRINVSSWMEAAQQFRQGILFPQWAAGANYGFGEPRFVFYPPISWTLGGVLGLLLPWTVVPAVYVWMTLVIAGISMWKCANDLLEPWQALVAGIIYAVNPYMMVTAYTRCAYADLLAGAFLPLLIWAALRFVTTGGRSVLPLSAILAAIWLTNLPVAVIATYSVGFLVLIQAILRRSARILMYGAGAICMALGLAAFRLVPATWETRWVDIAAVLKPDALPWRNFLFAHDNLPSALVFNKKLSLLAVGIALAVVAASALARKFRPDESRIWPLSALAALSIFLMFRPSLLLWRFLPGLRFVQFPWRWLHVLCAVGVLLTALVISAFKRSWLAWLSAGLLLIAIDGAIMKTEVWTKEFVHEVDYAVASQQGYPGLPEYAPFLSRAIQLPRNAALVTASDGGSVSQVAIEQWSPEMKVINVNARKALQLDLKLLAYPAWQASVDDRPVNMDTNLETGQILVRLPPGLSRVQVAWTRTWDHRIGTLISLVALLLGIVVQRVMRSVTL
jgi:hypothetical protein